MKFGSSSILVVVVTTVVPFWGTTAAWLQPSFLMTRRSTAPPPTPTALHMYMGARNSTTRSGSSSSSSRMNSRRQQQQVLMADTPPTTTTSNNNNEKEETTTSTMYDKNVTNFEANMEDQLKELEDVNQHVEHLDLHQKEHFLVSDIIVEDKDKDKEDSLDDMTMPEQQQMMMKLPELELVDNEFIVSDNIEMDELNDRSQTMELPTLIDDEFIVSENIYMDENHERSRPMELPPPAAEMSMDDVTQDFHISENIEDTKAKKLELPKIVDDVFIVSDNIRSDENHERSKRMELPEVETSVDITQDFYISENIEDRKSRKIELPTTTTELRDNNEEHFIVSDNMEDNKPITVVDKDFRISDPIITGDGEPVKMTELVDGEFLVSENIKSQDRDRSKRVKVTPAAVPVPAAFEFLDNLKDMDLVPPLKLNVNEEDVQKLLKKAQEGTKTLIEWGRLAVRESAVIAQDIQKSLPVTTVGKKEETYEQALQKMGKGATGVWTLMKEFGGFVKETAAQVDLAQAESILDNFKEQTALAMEDLQTKAKSVRLPVIKKVSMDARNQVEVEDEDDALEIPYFLK